MTGSEKKDNPSGNPQKSEICKGCWQFYGNPSTDDLCSQCFRVKSIQTIKLDAAKYYNKEQTQTKTEEAAKNNEDKTLERQASSKKVPETCRCVSCSKKVGLLGFKCQCGSTFCRNHRMPECHGCTFDFGKVGKERLVRENVVVKAEKVIKF